MSTSNESLPAISLWRRVVMLMELIRFSHTIFALPFALLAGLLAARLPLSDGSLPAIRWRDAVAILLCMIFARSAAMAFNRLVDRVMDGENPRTKGRHLPAGLLSVHGVAWFCGICVVGFLGTTAVFLPNPLPLILSVPVMGWLLGYSYAKRFTSAAHLWLGVALAMAPTCAWIALRGMAVWENPYDLAVPLVLSSAVALWVAGFDIIYACQDWEFDRVKGLYSIPAKLGLVGALRCAALLHAGMVVMLFGLPFVDARLGLGWIYFVTLIGISGLLAYQHFIVRPDDLQRVGFAFFQINAAISLLLMTSAALDNWWG